MKEESGLYTINMVDTILDLLTRISRKTDELQPLTLKGEKKFHQENNIQIGSWKIQKLIYVSTLFFCFFEILCSRHWARQ